MAETITVETELGYHSLRFSWEPLWDDVYDHGEIESSLRSLVSNVLCMGIAKADSGPGFLELWQLTDNEWIASGVPVQTRKGPNAIEHEGKWWTLEQEPPKCKCIPVNIRSRLGVARVLGCTYDKSTNRWRGEIKVRME